MFERIVVGVTKEATAREAVERAQELARRFDAELHVVTAFDGSDERQADEASTMLDNLAMASAASMRMHSEPGHPADAICRVVEQVNADLVIVGNKGLAGSSRWAKSVPGKLTRRSPCAVLVLDTI